MKSKIQKWNTKHKYLFGIVMLTFVLVGSFFIASPTYAWTWKDLFDWGLDEEETKQAMKFLNNDWIVYSTVIGAIWQSMIGAFIKGLLIIVGMLEGLIPKTFSLFDVLNDVGLNQFTQSMIKGLFVGIFTLIITWLGIRTMIMHKPPKFKSVVINVIMMVVLVGGLNEIMAQMQKLSVDFYNASTEGQKYEDGLAWKLVKDNTADIMYLSQNSFDPIKSKDTLKTEKNALTKEMFLNASLGDLVTPEVVKKIEEKIDGEGGPGETKFLKYKLTNDGKSETLEKIEDSSFDIFKKVTDTGYKRYPMNSFTIICALLSLGIAYAFTLFVFVITIFELVMKKVVAPLVFITDIESGQKTKMVLEDIFKGFLLIAFTGISMRIYTILVTYVGNADLGMVLYIISMMALTTLLIKGSESILRYFGVDVGLKDGKNHLLGAWAAMKGAQGLGKGAMNLGRNAKEKLQGNQQSREETPKRSEGDGTASGEAAATTPSRSGIARRIGTATGYAANRGAGGMMKDAGNKALSSANEMFDSGKSKVSDAANNVKDNVKGTVSDFKEGQNQGRQTAQQHADRDTLNQIGKDVMQNANQGNDKAADIQNANPHTSKMGGTDTNGSELKGTSEDVQKDINLQKQLRDNGLDMNQGSDTNGKPGTEQMQKDIALQEKVNSTGSAEAPGKEMRPGTEQMQRDIALQEKLNNSGNANVPGTENRAGTEQVQKDIALQEKLNNSGKANVPGTENRAGTEQVQKDIALQEKLNNSGKANVPGTESKGGTEQIQKEVAMQEQLRSNGTVNPPGTDMRVQSQEVQKEVNVRDHVKNEGAAVSPGNDMKGTNQTINRDVEVKNNVKDGGTVDSPIRGTSQTIHRDVEMKNNVKDGETVDSPIRGTSQTIHRDVEVKNNVKDGETVDSPVRGTSQTVHRDVEVKNNINDGGTVDSPIRGTSQTVHRDVEVKNNINDGGTVDSPIRGTSQTVHRDVQVKEQVHENTASQRNGVPTFKRRGTAKSRFDQLND
ncbi:pLS20_p028 family conjugation system transmembrane protein [Bacillus sp. FSL R9-9410]|uniref:pLS20_p028 family conjugation system transmembrane protein n=1 Tax=Bacillus sp. FSL R9-9410 TaxID=2921590 RepID=UPI0031011921